MAALCRISRRFLQAHVAAEPPGKHWTVHPKIRVEFDFRRVGGAAEKEDLRS